MVDVHDESEEYVCITHQCLIPCEKGDSHLISNWKSDVEKIKRLMRKK